MPHSYLCAKLHRLFFSCKRFTRKKRPKLLKFCKTAKNMPYSIFQQHFLASSRCPYRPKLQNRRIIESMVRGRSYKGARRPNHSRAAAFHPEKAVETRKAETRQCLPLCRRNDGDIGGVVQRTEGVQIHNNPARIIRHKNEMQLQP